LTLDSGGSFAGTSRARLTPEEQISLAERIRNHDSSAEEVLVRVFSPRVAFLAFVRTHDAEVARDLAQEVLLAVVCALRNGQLHEAERLPGFVYGTARNLINNYLRKRTRLPAEDPIDATLYTASAPDPVENRERRALVRRALAGLTSTDRRILLLTLVDGLKPTEIAARLGLTSEVVRTRKSRAVKEIVERVKALSRT